MKESSKTCVSLHEIFLFHVYPQNSSTSYFLKNKRIINVSTSMCTRTTASMRTWALRGSVGRGEEVAEMAHEQWQHELVAFLLWQRHLPRLLEECENLGETRIGCC